MAICTTHNAFLYLSLYCRPRPQVVDEVDHFINFAVLVVELQNNRVTLAAVHARVFPQIIQKPLPAFIADSSLVRPAGWFRAWIRLLRSDADTCLAMVLQAVRFAAVPAELTLLLVPFAPGTDFQGGKG
jgi:hypothetical protein